MEKKYIRIFNDTFGFVSSAIHTITENDRYVSEEIYSKFFEEQTLGKQLKIRDINGLTFEEIFEEIIPEIQPMTLSLEPTLEERVKKLEEAIFGKGE